MAAAAGHNCGTEFFRRTAASLLSLRDKGTRGYSDSLARCDMQKLPSVVGKFHNDLPEVVLRHSLRSTTAARLRNNLGIVALP
jgi:hypothetical protein